MAPGFGRAIGVFLNGNGIRERDRRGEPITDRHFFVLFNGSDEPIDFTIPAAQYSPRWDVVVDTAGHLADSGPRSGGDVIALDARSLEYELFTSEGETELKDATDYTSANTEQLDVNGAVDLLMTLPEIQQIVEARA